MWQYQLVVPATTTAAAVTTPTRQVTGFVVVVTSISPSTGSTQGGTLVSITGSGFTGSTSVTFAGVAGTSLTVVSDTSLKAVTPAHASGTVDVQVVTPTGKSATSASSKYTFVAPPTISKVAPTSGPLSGGTTVTITGTGFTSSATVKFGSVNAAGVTVLSSTQLTAVSPAGSPGSVDVSVTTSGGTSPAGSSAKFTYEGCIRGTRHISADVTSTMTWSPECVTVYILDAPVAVLPGVTLSVAPGTIVKAAPGSSLSVQGSLVAAGTAAAPVTFTS
ncbi:IPT/TIG domain-containing protein, partial [Pedococcus aerophilus]|uniref:IPT/TIG domain-containing protein n=1 Tax=Pedococcus aerophilus TaxID=436356 RepID=UPI003CD0854A